MTRRIPWIWLVFVAALFVPALGSRYYTFLANDVLIWALFATSLNLLVGYTGLVSFGHAAYFGIGAYTTGILMKKIGLSFLLAFPLGGLLAALFALVFGFFCVRLTRIYFAMLTLAFAQIVWAVCLKWNEVTGGEQGMPEIPYPDFGSIDRLAAFVPVLGGYRTAEQFYFLTLVLVAACLLILRRIVGSPFGRMLATIRENPERAEFIGVNVRRYELAAFVLSGGFAGLAGAFFGPALGAAVLIWLNQQIVSYTEYWPLVLGTILVVLLFVFPGGIAGALALLLRRSRRGVARA